MHGISHTRSPGTCIYKLSWGLIAESFPSAIPLCQLLPCHLGPPRKDKGQFFFFFPNKTETCCGHLLESYTIFSNKTCFAFGLKKKTTKASYLEITVQCVSKLKCHDLSQKSKGVWGNFTSNNWIFMLIYNIYELVKYTSLIIRPKILLFFFFFFLDDFFFFFFR